MEVPSYSHTQASAIWRSPSKGPIARIGELCGQRDLRPGRVRFVEGETRNTLPVFAFESQMDAVLLDGPHAYPLPQIEFAYLFPRLRPGGWLAIDDIQIPSVHELFRFLHREPAVAFEEVIVRTAFFRKVKEPETGPDGWMLQGINRRLVLRYSWRDRLRRMAGQDDSIHSR